MSNYRMILSLNFPKWSQITYHRLASPNHGDLDSEDERDEQSKNIHCVLEPASKLIGYDLYGKLIKFVLAGLLCLSAGILLGYASGRNYPSVVRESEPKDYCSNAPSRQEWSQLSLYEKSDFIVSVRRMAYEKSQARPDGALYDDFPYIRAEYGSQCKIMGENSDQASSSTKAK